LLKSSLGMLPASWHRGTALNSQLLSFLAFQPALTIVEYAWLAVTRPVDNSSGRGLAIALLTGDPITIITDRASEPSLIQADNWHDLTGHHRYYGAAAYSGSLFCSRRQSQ